jgi:hypothetical protein
MSKGNDRFEVVYEQGVMTCYKIIVDKETGVNYLFTNTGYAAGLTVLLSNEGKPVITPVEQRY